MQKILQDILQDLLKEFDEHINTDILIPQLQIKKLLTEDEVALVKHEITNSAKRFRMIELLKAKPDDIITDLQLLFFNLQWDNLQRFLEKKLKDLHFELLLQPLQKSKSTETAEVSVEALLESLCYYYEFDLEYMEKYWDQFCVRRKFEMDTFYDENNKILQNIDIYDQKGRLKIKEISTYSDIFDSGYKKILLTGEAGYGKSTFVHEIARQWRKHDSYLREKFNFILLFRLGELKQKKTFDDVLAIPFAEMEANRMHLLLQNKEFQKNILLIFDGYDVYEGECPDIWKMITDHHFQATVLITSRDSVTTKIEKELSHRLLKLTLKGFNEHGINMQMSHFGVQLEEKEKERLHNVLKVPLFMTMYCILKLNEIHKTEIFQEETELYDLISEYIDFLVARNPKTSFNLKSECNYESIIMIIGKLAFKNIIQKYKKLGCGDIFFSLEQSLNLENEIILDIQSIGDACLNAAKIGFLSKNSSPKETESGEMTADLIFPHELFSEYFAAKYFCSKIFPNICNKRTFHNTEWVWSHCSYFATGIDKNYKNVLWTKENLFVDRNPASTLFTERFQFRIVVPWVVHVENQAKLAILLTEETSLAFGDYMNYKNTVSLNKLELIWQNEKNFHYGLHGGILNGKNFKKLSPFQNVNKLTIEYCELEPSFIETLLNSNIKNIIFARNDGEEKSIDSELNVDQPILMIGLESIQGHLFRPFFKPLMKFLPNCISLKKVDIELIDDGLIYEEFLQMIHPENNICKTLQHLTIRYCLLSDDNVQLLESLYHLWGLKELSFYDCQWSDEAPELLIQQFCENKFPDLQTFCMMEGSYLEKFQLFIYRPNPKRQHPKIDFLKLLQSIVSLKDFRTLKLRYCCLLGPYSYNAIKEFYLFINKMNVQPALEYLELSESCLRIPCELEELLQLQSPLDVSESIVDKKIYCDCSRKLLSLSWFSKLKYLYLSECHLNLCSGHELAKVFQHKVVPFLEIIDISSNPELGQCVTLFSSLSFLPNLIELNVHECGMLLESCDAFSEVITSGQFENLSRLNLSDNIAVGSCEKLLFSFSGLSSLSLLNLQKCGLAEDIRNALESCFIEKIKT